MIWKKTKDHEHDKESVERFAVDGIRRILPRKERLSSREKDVQSAKAETKETPPDLESVLDKHGSLDKDADDAKIRSAKEQSQEDAALAAPPVDPRVAQIEEILSEGLEDMFYELPENIQVEFKRSGEEASRKISVLIQQARVKAGKILKIILDWLKMLPGVNRLFIEQQAKIKLDKILALRDKN